MFLFLDVNMGPAEIWLLWVAAVANVLLGEKKANFLQSHNITGYLLFNIFIFIISISILY